MQNDMGKCNMEREAQNNREWELGKEEIKPLKRQVVHYYPWSCSHLLSVPILPVQVNLLP